MRLLQLKSGQWAAFELGLRLGKSVRTGPDESCLPNCYNLIGLSTEPSWFSKLDVLRAYFSVVGSKC